jgi:phosphoenolpyruvate carboxylase
MRRHLTAGARCSCREWNEEQRMEFLLNELTGKRPLLPPNLPMTPEVSTKSVW